MRYLTANEMRADLEAMIRKLGWEADSLALQNYMQQVFADKLRRQEEDIRESGFGSLEDFLLTVDEKSTVSWIKSVGVKTPSEGLPPAPTRLPGITRGPEKELALAHTQEVSAIETPMAEVDSGGLELGGDVDDLPGEATSFSAMPVFDDDPRAKKLDSESYGTADTAPITEIPKELRKPLFAAGRKPVVEPLLPPLQQRVTMPPIAQRATLPPMAPPDRGELPSLPTAIVSKPELSALPTAIVAPSLEKVAPPRSAPTPGPSSTVELSAADFAPGDLQPQPTTLLANANQVAMQAVTEDPSRTLPPGQVRGAMPAVSAAHDITLNPRPDPFKQQENTTAPRPAFDPPQRKRWPIFAAAGALVAIVITAVAWPKAAPAMSTLVINLDQPAVIAVDGKEEPPAQQATVAVQPGKSHVVTVLRAGKVVRTINIPGMAPGEQQQFNVILR
jgi:hypothetical protein